ncbi:hypothetical protein P22_3535 [Propionispora sp. 2/2-37]|uniref:hypothetical protein n=1 Tax=Propionispora sp. 2/2-37 TaxID=1677858 RepID=UPI0006BB89D1|nr:hypothetical protein [Propionispora sp. 2/2-37]CUH97406.1 hypothetical protein P22_3535 [Propionispora sp. 2/2-37]
MREKVSQEYIVAIHEAGHAVMAAILGNNIDCVSILSEESMLGKCKSIDNYLYKTDRDTKIQQQTIAVANALIEQKKLSGKQVIKIMDSIA